MNLQNITTFIWLLKSMRRNIYRNQGQHLSMTVSRVSIIFGLLVLYLIFSLTKVDKVEAAISSFSDNFSVAQSIGSDTDYTRINGLQQLSASGGMLTNGTCSTTNGNYAVYRTTQTFTSPDYEVSMDINNGAIPNYHLLLIARVQDSNNFYYVNAEFGGSTYYGKMVNGSTTNNTIFLSAPGNGDTLKLKVQGSTISVIWGGQVKGSFSDSTFATAGSAGFGMGNISGITQSGAASAGCSPSQQYDNFTVSGNSAPTIISGPTVTYQSGTRTGPNNYWNIQFTPQDGEQTGGSQLTYYIYTGPNRTGTQVGSGTATSGTQTSLTTLPYTQSGIVAGTNTLYVEAYDGTLFSTDYPVSLLRDDVAPTAATSISTTPNTVASANYTVTFTPNDATSTNGNEISYKICPANDTCPTPITGGTGTSTSGQAKTTGTLTDSSLVNGSNTRWIRTCDGANNCTNTSFTFTFDQRPSVTTNAAGSLTTTTAVLNATVNPNGASTNVSYLWGDQSGISCDLQPNTLAGPNALTGTSNLSGATTQVTLPSLSPNRTYYFCVMATNSFGTNYGSVVPFTTSATPGAYTYMDAGSVLGGGATDCYDDSGAPCPAAMGGVSAPAYNQTNINWSAAAGPAPTSYDVYYCTGSNSCTPTILLRNIASTSTTQTTSATTWYGYNIIAKNAIGSAKSSSGNAYVQTPANCTNGYIDNDFDGYGGGSFGCYTSGNIVGTGGDCYDFNANAYPGQTLYFSTNRGDGSYDYDCSSGSITYQFSNTYYCVGSISSYPSSTSYNSSTGFNYCGTPGSFSSGAVPITLCSSVTGPATPSCGQYITSWNGYYMVYANSCSSFLGYNTPSQQQCH